MMYRNGVIIVKKLPGWVIIIFAATFSILIAGPFFGIIATVLIYIYLVNHGFFDKSIVQKPDHIPGSRFKPGPIPPNVMRKVEFLSNHEIVFSNFSYARYLQENGSHQMVEMENCKKAKIFIRLNTEQFDVYIVNDGKSDQLSFEKSNLKILDITNHYISMIEGNKGESYLKIQYDNQYFTTLEVEDLMDFFHEFSIDNKTTKFQEKSFVENVPPIIENIKKDKKRLQKPIKIILAIFVCCMVGITAIGVVDGYISAKNDVRQESIMGVRRKNKFINDISYEVSNELIEDDWGGYEIQYKFSKHTIPLLMVRNEIKDIDYTETYNYEKSTFDDLEKELYLYEYQYHAQKKQYDYVNLENGKWYHLSGILPKGEYYNNDSHKDLYVDIYVMPTSKSLVQVTMLRTIDDVNDYDMNDFLSTFDFSELMSVSM